MGKEKQVARFGVGAADGLRSSVWRVWTAADGSIYVGDRLVAGRVKASLHATGQWHFRMKDPSGNVVGNEHRWQRPTPVRNGITKAFTVLIPWAEVVRRSVPISKPNTVQWWPAPAPGTYRSFTVLLGPHGMEVRNAVDHPDGPQIAATFALPNETVFLLTRELPMPDEFAARLQQYREAMNRMYGALDQHPHWVGTTGDPHGHLFGQDEDGCRWFIDITPLEHRRGTSEFLDREERGKLCDSFLES